METVVPFLSVAAASSLQTDQGFGPGQIISTLILVGAALVLLETLLPGLIAGVLGLLCLAAGVFMGYANFGVRTGNLILMAVLAGLVIGTLCWVKYFPNSHLAKLFVKWWHRPPLRH